MWQKTKQNTHLRKMLSWAWKFHKVPEFDTGSKQTANFHCSFCLNTLTHENQVDLDWRPFGDHALAIILDRQHSGKSFSWINQVIYWSPPFKEKSQAIHIHIYTFFSFWSPYRILMNSFKPSSLWLYIFNYVACLAYSYSVLCDVKK